MKLEPSRLGYSELVEQLKAVPISYLPALLAEVVEQCVKRSVFLPTRLLPFVEQCEAEALTEKEAKHDA